MRVLAPASRTSSPPSRPGPALPDGRLDFGLLIEKFAAFWIADGEILAETRYYSEAAAQAGTSPRSSSGWSTEAGSSTASTASAAAGSTCSSASPTATGCLA